LLRKRASRTLVPRGHRHGKRALSSLALGGRQSREKPRISFHQINKPTGERVRHQKVDASGEAVVLDDIVKAVQIEPNQSVRIEREEIEDIEPETSHAIEIVKFVPQAEIDDLYHDRPYYVVPDGRSAGGIRCDPSCPWMAGIARAVSSKRERKEARRLTRLAFLYPRDLTQLRLAQVPLSACPFDLVPRAASHRTRATNINSLSRTDPLCSGANSGADSHMLPYSSSSVRLVDDPIGARARRIGIAPLVPGTLWIEGALGREAIAR
jgi:hypothetical protein